MIATYLLHHHLTKTHRAHLNTRFASRAILDLRNRVWGQTILDTALRHKNNSASLVSVHRASTTGFCSKTPNTQLNCTLLQGPPFFLLSIQPPLDPIPGYPTASRLHRLKRRTKVWQQINQAPALLLTCRVPKIPPQLPDTHWKLRRARASFFSSLSTALLVADNRV